MSSIQNQNGNLNGSLKSQGNLSGELYSQGSLNGRIWIPQDGKSAYEIAVENGFEGTVIEWLESLKGGGSNTPKIGEVTLLASTWVGEDKRYSQTVEIKDVTNKSQVDLTPDDEQLLVFYDKDVTFVTKNEGGVVTVIAIGQKPMNDYTVQVTITEVNVPDGTIIWGVTVGTTISPESLAKKLDIGETLPTVTDNDEGKVLKAQGGKWTAQEDEIARSLTNLEIEELIKNFT